MSRLPKFLVIFFILPFTIYGQISLEMAWEKAIMNAPLIKEKENEVQIAEIEFRLSEKRRYPVIDAQYSNIFNLGRSIDPYSNQYLSQSILGNNFGISATYTLFNGGLTKEEIERSHKLLKISGYAFSHEINEIKLQILLTFTEVLLAQDQINLLTGQKEAAQNQLMYFEKLYLEGRQRYFSLESLRAEILNYQLRIIDAEKELNLSKNRLSSYTSIPLNEIKVLEPFSSKSKFKISSQNIALVGSALYHLPEISSFQIRQSIKQHELKIAHARRLPEISAILNLGTTYSSVAQTIENNELIGIPYANQLWGNMNMASGIVVRVPIFNKTNYKENKSKIKLEQELLNAQLASAKLEVNTYIQEAVIQYAGFLEKMKTMESRIIALKDLFEIAELGFQEGRMDLTEYLQSKRTYEEALLQMNQVNHQIALQEKILNFYQTGLWQ